MVSVVWRIQDMMGLVYEDETHMKTMQGIVPQGLASLVEDVIRAEGWNIRPWDGKDNGWVATRKEDKK